MWELFLQCGPVGAPRAARDTTLTMLMRAWGPPPVTVNVFIPKDRVTGLHQGFGFVEFLTEEDADYAIKILNMIKLFNKPLRVNKVHAARSPVALMPLSLTRACTCFPGIFRSPDAGCRRQSLCGEP